MTSRISKARHFVDEILDTTHSVTNIRPSEAEQRIHHDYEPLLGQRKIPVCDSEESCHYEGVRKIEIAISYGIFFVLGASILIGWNAVLLSTLYFKARTQGAYYEASLGSCVSLAFTGANLGFLALANSTQSKANLAHRIAGSLITLGVGIIFLISSTFFPIINPNLFFYTLILVIIMMGGSAAFLQGSTVALSSRFGPMHVQGILSGQGAIGLIIASLQLFSTLSLEPKVPKSINLEFIPLPIEVLDSAFDFFLAILVFTIVSFLCHQILIQLPYYKLIIREAEHSSDSSRKEKSIWKVEKKIRFWNFYIFYIFLITLSIFPAISARVLSTEKESGLLGRFSKPELFIPLGFVIFNAFDWIGRALPQLPIFTLKNKKLLAISTLARTAFVPLFLMCNISGATTLPIISSDLSFLILMAGFAISNGFLSTCIMLTAIQDPSLAPDEIDIAATLLSFVLTAGLAVGSLLSFPLSGLI